MRFLADMGVSQQVVEWLRTNGRAAVHLHDEGLQRLPNGEIFQKAGREQRIVLTFDLDFGGNPGRKCRPDHQCRSVSTAQHANRFCDSTPQCCAEPVER
ncbi:MAG: DUF5615 family PIN-like protein [Gemmataceae bacterium]